MSIKASKDNSQWISAKETQGALEGDWVGQEVVVDYLPKEYCTVENTSTSTTLDSYDVLTQGDKVRLYNGTDGVVNGSLGSVSTSNVSGAGVNIHDIFNDGSAVATYNLDGNATDLSGNYNGTETSITYTTGKYGQGAIVTNNNSNKISLGTPIGIGVDKTVSMWVKQTTATTYSYAFSQGTLGTTGTYEAIVFGYADSKINFKSRYTSSYIRDITSDITPSLNTWYHIVYTVSGTTSTLYINGVNKGTSTVSSIGTSSGAMELGASTAPSDQWLDGVIDQVRIFNRALTSTEVSTLYNEQATKYTSDITSFGLTTAPTKAYKDETPMARLSVDTKSALNTLDVLTIDGTSTSTSLVTTSTIADGDSLIVDGNEIVASGVTGTNPYTLDITSLGLSATPTKAYKQNNTALTITGTPTTTTASVVEEVVTGEVLLLDGSEVGISGVVDSSTDSTGTHNIFGDGSTVATYNLDGNVNDLGSTYNGTLGSGTFTTGKYGQALGGYGSSFNTYPCVTNNFTYSFWVKLGSTTGLQRFMQSYNGHLNYGIIFNNDAKIGVYHVGTGLSYLLTDSITLDTNWHHIVYTKSSSTGAILYYDGTPLITQSGQTGALDTSSGNNSFIGNNLTNSDGEFGALIDQVRIFNKALTQTEVTSLFNEQVTKFDLTFPAQGSAPTSIERKENGTVATKSTDTFDGTKFTWTSTPITKTGRELQYSLTADVDMQVSKVQINLSKEP